MRVKGVAFLLSAGFTGVVAAGLLNISFVSMPGSVSPDWDAGTYVYQALDELGNKRPAFYPSDMSPETVQRGYDLIYHGRTDDPDGHGKSKFISIYYVCTNCHNTGIEDPVLTVSDPQARLQYAVQHNMPFLQGTTFYGVINRETWYNDDYYKKYGDLVKPARNDVREAIQLCARECSKGRPLEDWEVNAILAYYYANSYRLGDIMETSEINDLNKRKKNSEAGDDLIQTIKSKYELKSPATFVEPPYDRDFSKLPTPDPENGRLVYEKSCQSCHKAYGVSEVVFDNTTLSFNKFERDFKKNYWWLYEIARHGTYGYAGHESYMPLFPKERLSDQQIDDMKAYFDQMASHK